MVRPKVNGVGVELDHPFIDVATRFLVVEDVTEWVLGDHYNGISLEVVVELPGRDQDGIL